LPADLETTIYRIVQEALTNITKHAQATNVSILLVRRGHAVMTVVEDDGKGFDPSAVRDEALGLVGIRERVGLLNGRVSVESSSSGTTIAVEVPLP
jgi:signal transduction histidine kinase